MLTDDAKRPEQARRGEYPRVRTGPNSPLEPPQRNSTHYTTHNPRHVTCCCVGSTEMALRAEEALA